MVKKRNNGNSLAGTMLQTGIGTMVGIGMINATSSMVNTMPEGTAKSITGIVPGLQATTLVAHNAGAIGKVMGTSKKQKPLSKLKKNKIIW